MGVMASVGSAWERGARRRHRRRLEVLKAKAELKSAQAAARGVTGPVAINPAAASAPHAAASFMAEATPWKSPAAGATPTQLERLFASHDAVTARWLDYELDVAKLIAFPAMSDGRQPLTAAFLRAKRVADGLRPASAKARLSKDQLTEYRNAVADYEVAFDVAERDARRLKDSSFTTVERKRPSNSPREPRRRCRPKCRPRRPRRRMPLPRVTARRRRAPRRPPLGRSPRGAPTRPRVGSSAPSRIPDGDSMAWRPDPRHPLSAGAALPYGARMATSDAPP